MPLSLKQKAFMVVFLCLWLPVCILFAHDLSWFGAPGFCAAGVLFCLQLGNPRSVRFSIVGLPLAVITGLFYWYKAKPSNQEMTTIAHQHLLLFSLLFVWALVDHPFQLLIDKLRTSRSYFPVAPPKK